MKKLPKPNGIILYHTVELVIVDGKKERKGISYPVKDYTGKRYIKDVRKLE